MPKIEVSTIVRKKDKQAVYDLLKEMQNFPIFMHGVKKLDIIEKKDNKMITSWKVEIDGASLLWKEEDTFNDKEKSLKFKMLEGDYDNYEGKWQLEELSGDTKIILSANFDWGVPAFEKLVGDVLRRKARNSLRSMLNAIKKLLEKKNG